MTEQEVQQYWDENAVTWTELVRKGYDIYRDLLNTPAFLASMPDVRDRYGLDIGCGEGHNTRLLASRGAIMQAIDSSPVFIELAANSKENDGMSIQYQVASATKLPFTDNSFDFATSFMCMMDIPDASAAIAEAFRVVKPGGFFQFSIEHPCFKTRHFSKVKNSNGDIIAFEVGDYFSNSVEVQEWIFKNAATSNLSSRQKFNIPVFHRPLSYWINALIQAGFRIEMIAEPRPDEHTMRSHPEMTGADIIAYFLHIRCQK